MNLYLKDTMSFPGESQSYPIALVLQSSYALNSHELIARNGVVCFRCLHMQPKKGALGLIYIV